ncbi:MAG: DUF1501 domain-containing protein [Rudaea sp.]
MSFSRKSRREFLRNLGCIACGGTAAALLPQLRMMSTVLASTSVSSTYQALVCVYLYGGNDAWNMLVPFDNTRFNTYASSRSGVYDPVNNPGGLGLALPTGSQVALQKIVDGNDTNSATNQYFLHPSMPEMTTLFNQGHLAFVVNAGSLVKPITMSDYNSSSANYPAQLFSHADQTNQWQQAYAVEASTLGWGGQCGDALNAGNSYQTLSPCISVAGANRFEVGVSTIPYQIGSGGLTYLAGVCNPTPCNGVSSASVRDNALNTLLAETYANDFAGNYSSTFQLGRELFNVLSPGLAGITLNTAFPAGNSLGAQLQIVAKMIKLSMAQNYATRQIYFVNLGSFDLHSGMMTGNNDHAALLTTLSQALNAFWTCMGPGDVNAQNNVTLFTMSEFARTLQSNGSGSDHGWGTVQMALGGAVKGGKLYSNGGGPITGFPNQALNAPNNFPRGQMIPGIGVEQYAATLAQWMGITSPTDLATIFPNLGQFGTNNLGFV